MNKYQKVLNSATKEVESYYKMSIKLKYKDKWLKGGTPINHPIHISYDEEFNKYSYTTIRSYLKLSYRDINKLKSIRDIIATNNKEIYYILFNEDIKYNNR
ncbi:hypothetical protein [Faecalimicrobium dakarense]|uniref:hypothetical protein n=1 Tax=Faecalimicrobium dakarense TaxID=1301100 RepID=UPI0004AEBDDA|nr:hypothetical protein [[Clostridium] dakarense]